MGGSPSQFLSFVLLLLCCYTVTVTGDEEICPTSACGDDGPAISFPFRIQGSQPENCGYPEFDLTCNSNMTILKVSSSGEYWLQEIDYINQVISINDPNGCLPRRLLTFDLWNSPFRSASYENYTMLGCSTENYSLPFTPPYQNINCMSNSTYEVWATASKESVDMMTSGGCQVITTVAVPIPWSGYYDDSQLSFSDLSEDLKLTWDVPQCGSCEAKGGWCGFKNKYSSLEVECFGIPGNGESSFIITFALYIGIGVPALLCALGITFYICWRVKRYRRRNSSAVEAAAASSSTTVNPQSQPTVVVMGLDNSTIESYPKAVLGESGRLSKPSDNTCPICLSEYQPRETLRTIPQCQHCFHADCIDAWLRMSATCPMCRTSPSPLSAQPSSPTLSR